MLLRVKCLGIMRINVKRNRYVPTEVNDKHSADKTDVNGQQNALNVRETTQLIQSNARPGILEKKY